MRGTLPRRATGTPASSAPTNRDDILFVTSEQTGFGYFRNFGETRRAGARARRERPASGASRSAPATPSSTPRSRARRPSTARATAATTPRENGSPGLEGTIEIEPGDRMPLIPAHMLQGSRDIQVTSAAGGRTWISSPCRARSRAATRTTAMSPTACTTSAPARHRLRRRQSRRLLPVHPLAPGHRAGQQPVRSPLLHRRPARDHSDSPTPAPSSRARFPPSMASFRSGMERSSRPARRSGCGSARASRSDHNGHRGAFL